MTPTPMLRAYLSAEQATLEPIGARAHELASEALDELWWQLSDSDREWLDARDAFEEA